MIVTAESLVVDASVLVDLLGGTALAAAVADRLRGAELHAPAHADAEVLSALGRLHRGGHLTVDEVDGALRHLAAVPMRRHPVAELLSPAWAYRAELRLVDALYVALADRLDVPLVTTDQRLARGAERAEGISQQENL